METTESQVWRKCSTCKKPIAFGARYYECSVSTCTNERTGYVFCTVGCFEAHLPGARHRAAGAIEKMAPKAGQISQASRILVRPTPAAGAPVTTARPQMPQEVLIVASRLKEYILARSEYATSGAVMDVLSDHVRILCDRAIDNARAEGRKTVLDRDFDFLKKS
jgi:hypothetical protein